MRHVGVVHPIKKVKSKLACIPEVSESARLRMGKSLPTRHEDHISGKGDNSQQHYNLVHKFIPMPQAMKIPAAKAAVDVKTTPQMTRFLDAKVCNEWLQMKLTITEYSLTTNAQVDYKLQKERTQHLVLRLRGETERQDARHQ